MSYSSADLVRVYAQKKSLSIASLFSRYIHQLSEIKEFAVLEPWLIYQVLDSCDNLSPEDSLAIYNNIAKHQHLNLEEFLAHAKSQPKQDMSIFECTHSPIRDIYTNEENLRCIINSQNIKISSLEQKLSVLQSQYSNLEDKLNKIASSHIASKPRDDTSNSTLCNDLKHDIQNQNESIKSIQDYIENEISRKIDNVSKTTDDLTIKVDLINRLLNYQISDLEFRESDSSGSTESHQSSSTSAPDRKDTIFASCLRGDIDSVRKELKVDPHSIYSKDDSDKTLLHIAAENGYYGLCKFLINEGSDIARKDKCGKTPLDIASENNHTEVFELLLHHGASASQG